MILAEIYFKDVWRLGIVAQGFNGGLAALVEHFGGEITVETPASVYSALSNGAVSTASLQPKIRMQYGNQVVECLFNRKMSAKAKSRFVYTYAIGIAIINEMGACPEFCVST